MAAVPATLFRNNKINYLFVGGLIWTIIISSLVPCFGPEAVDGDDEKFDQLAEKIKISANRNRALNTEGQTERTIKIPGTDYKDKTLADSLIDRISIEQELGFFVNANKKKVTSIPPKIAVIKFFKPSDEQIELVRGSRRQISNMINIFLSSAAFTSVKNNPEWTDTVRWAENMQKSVQGQLDHILDFFETFPSDAAVAAGTTALANIKCQIEWTTSLDQVVEQTFLHYKTQDQATSKGNISTISAGLYTLHDRLQFVMDQIHIINYELSSLNIQHETPHLHWLVMNATCIGAKEAHVEILDCQPNSLGIYCKLSVTDTTRLRTVYEVVPIVYPYFTVDLQTTVFMTAMLKQLYNATGCADVGTFHFCDAINELKDECIEESYTSEPDISTLLKTCTFRRPQLTDSSVRVITTDQGMLIDSVKSNYEIDVEEVYFNYFPVVLDSSLNFKIVHKKDYITFERFKSVADPIIRITQFNKTILAEIIKKLGSESTLQAIKRAFAHIIAQLLTTIIGSILLLCACTKLCCSGQKRISELTLKRKSYPQINSIRLTRHQRKRSVPRKPQSNKQMLTALENKYPS